MNIDENPIQFILAELWDKHGGLEIVHQLGNHMLTQPKYEHLVREMEKIREAIAEANRSK